MKQRIFIAFKISDEARNELGRIQKEFDRTNKRNHVKWTNTKGMHVTVVFIGEIEDFEVELVRQSLKEIANNHHSFSYWLDRLDGFPNRTHPSIINARVEEEGGASRSIHDSLLNELKKHNLIKDLKPWKPHITIGRNKSQNKVVGFSTIELQKLIWKVDSVELIRSDLKYDGPKYTVLDSFTLK